MGHIFTYILLFSFITVSYSFCNPEIMVQLDKSKYFQGEKVKVKIEIINKGPYAVTIQASLVPTDGTFFLFYDEYGKRCGFIDDTPNWAHTTESLNMENNFVTLYPNFLYGLATPELDLFGLYQINKPGKYKLAVKCILWKHGEKYGINAWTGTLLSKPFEFELLKKR